MSGRDVASESKVKILIYNWVPFDNPWQTGGGVTVYCRNLISEIVKEPDTDVYFLSSGFAYAANKDKIYIRKIKNVFGERVHQYEVVNSPVPAEQRWMYVNPLVALENQGLKRVIGDFIENHGPFQVIHFNNIEGLSLDVLDLKQSCPETKFIYSIHNYVPLCVNGSYYMRHKHCNCNPNHTGEDCFQCTRADIRSNIAERQYKRALFRIEPKDCISQNRWIQEFGFERLDKDVSPDDILKFAQTATRKLNKNCDHILAVSKRTYDIAWENGFDRKKLNVSYIGTRIAERQIGHSAAKVKDGLRIVFLGSDINFEEKGYPFLLDTLANLDGKYASRIELVLTVKQAEHAEIYSMLKNFRHVRVVQKYTHEDLDQIFEGCHLSIIPVLWEDCLPQIAIEAVAYGVPVLSSSAGGASELCESELFRFKCGDMEDLQNKIIHFLNKPEDLETYWTAHHGLCTMERHWDELAWFYGISEKKPIKLSAEEKSRFSKKNALLYTINDDASFSQVFSTCGLYQAVRKLGWNPVVYDEVGKRNTVGQDYLKAHCCTLAEMCLHSDREEYLESFQAIITGSEKKWKCSENESVDKCFLNWGNPEAKRIAYAPTFGAKCDLPLGPQNAAYFLMKRLDAVAAADSGTQRILNLEFQIDTDAVCNPILLADDFAHTNVKDVEGLFISVFFEKWNNQKQKVAEMAEESLKYSVLDYSREAMVHKKVSVDEYLNAIEKSSLIITDSVAAMHLAIFYKKPFIAVLSRCESESFSQLSTLERLGLTERAIYVEDDVREKKYLCKKPVKYKLADCKLEKLRNESMKWLENSLNGQETDK